MDDEKIVQWSVIDRIGTVIWTGDFYINDNYELITGKEYYENSDLYDIIKLNINALNVRKTLRLIFYNEDKYYCYKQVQWLKNKYENNFPEIVYINGEDIKFNYTESIFETLAKYYKRYE